MTGLFSLVSVDLSGHKRCMLRNKDAIATIAVKDLKVAGKFYEETLGLKKDGSGEESAVTYASGNSKVLVYQSEFAGTNKATSATFTVGDELESIVQDLRNKGVKPRAL
jgi:hypothetical protein